MGDKITDFSECFYNDLYSLYYKKYALDKIYETECNLKSTSLFYRTKKWTEFWLIRLVFEFCFFITMPLFYLYGVIIFFAIYAKIVMSSTHNDIQNDCDSVAFVFDIISYKRIETFCNNYNENITCYGDFFNAISDISFFNLLKASNKIYIIPKIFVSGNIALFKSIAFYSRMNLPLFWNWLSIGYVMKRLFYTAAVGVVIEEIISSHKISRVYSGLRDERYAHILSRICKRFSVDTCCLPHGLCYRYKYPNGLFGDRYLAFNNSEKNFIEERYPEKKVELFRWDTPMIDEDRLDMVYFTTSRDIDADKSVLEYITKLKERVYVRLHPNDNAGNYPISGLYFLDDYSKSIQAKIVLSRPSTVLVEAERYGGKICVVLLSEEDLERFDLYPAFGGDFMKIEKLSDLKLVINE